MTAKSKVDQSSYDQSSGDQSSRDPLDRHQLIHLPVDAFLAVLAAETAVPGGGAAAALAGSLGAALAGMVARLTVDRPRYLAVADEMAVCRDQADALRARLASLVDADALAYAQVSAAYRLPKDGEDQRAERRAAIRFALEGAMLPQLETAAACVDVLEIFPTLIALGNRNAGTDASVGALLAHAGLQSAVRNVLANIEALDDTGIVSAARVRTVELLSAGRTALDAALSAASPAAGSGE